MPKENTELTSRRIRRILVAKVREIAARGYAETGRWVSVEDVIDALLVFGLKHYKEALKYEKES